MMRDRAAHSDPLTGLTAQERRILELIGEGLAARPALRAWRWRSCSPSQRSAGQRHDSLAFVPLMDRLKVALRGRGRPRTRPVRVLGDKACSSAAIRAHLCRQRIKATIPEPDDQARNRLPRGSRGGRPPPLTLPPGCSPAATPASGPTPAGQALAREARSLMEHHDRALAAVTSLAGNAASVTARQLRIGVPLTAPPPMGSRRHRVLGEVPATTSTAEASTAGSPLLRAPLAARA